MPRTTKKGRHSSKQHPCPLCINTTGSCKLNHDGSIYCYHKDPDSTPSGYVHIRELSGGMGQEFIESYVADELLRAANTLQSQGKRASARDMADLTSLPSSWAIAVQKAYPSNFPEWNSLSSLRSQVAVSSKPQMHNKVTQKPPTVVENFPQPSEQEVLSEKERDKQYLKISEQLQLNETHRNHLQDVRGLGEFINFIGFRSWEEKQVQDVSAELPGVVERNGSLYSYGQPGLFLPLHNELGQITSFQIRPDDPSNGKYKWGSSAPAGGNNPRLDNGEMPLTFCRPKSIKLPSIGLAL
jgi:hypothetical protein